MRMRNSPSNTGLVLFLASGNSMAHWAEGCEMRMSETTWLNGPLALPSFGCLLALTSR